MNSKIKKLISLFETRGIDAFLVTKDVNIRYLTGFPASESWLLVSRKKTQYITDFRYVLEARQGLTGITVTPYSQSIVETLFDLAHQAKIRSLGFDSQHMSLALFEKIKKQCPKSIKLVPRNDLIEELREIKTPDEIRLIRKALKLTAQAYRYAGRIIKPGFSERDILLKLERFVRSQKAAFSFDPIVASGPNSCFPHARVSDRKVRKNEPVLVDMGIDWQGYKSDLTRMFFLGKIPRSVQDVHEIVGVAQKKAIEKIKPGATARDIDRQARSTLDEQNLGRFFGHSLGHGVGLEIHEAPRLSQKSQTILKEGMVVTVEPAVYLPNQFGIRIEDMVLVTQKGCEVLSGDIH